MIESQQSATEAQRIANQIFDCAATEQRQIIANRPPALTAVTRQRAVLMALVLAVPILIAVLIMNSWETVMSWFEVAPPPAVALEQAQKALDDLVLDIESFRKDYDELPETLVRVGIPPRGRWDYTAIGRSRYTVQGTLYGQSVSFDSTRAPDRAVKQ